MVIQLKGNKGAADVGKIALWGFVLRAVLLIIMLSIKEYVSPYFISDDIAYEITAQRYMLGAGSFVDVDFLNKLLKGYMQPFWPVVLSIAARLFGTIYAGRVINIFLSTLCIPVIYKTVHLLTDDDKSARLAAKLFAFLPLPIILCCFPIKDIFLMLAVAYAFYVFLLFGKGRRVGVGKLLLCAAGLVCVYFTRGAVTELLLIFFFLLWMPALWKKKKYMMLVVAVALAVALLALFGGEVIASFQTKIEDYGGYNEASQGNLAMLQMTSITQIYKLPFAYIFATLQPMTLNYMGKSSNFWMWLMAFSNISMYPVAIANGIYIFQKKHNLRYWVCGTVMYCAIIAMCLGIFRHYMFLLPLQLINCSLCFDRKTPGVKTTVLLGSLGLALLVCLYSLLAFI